MVPQHHHYDGEFGTLSTIHWEYRHEDMEVVLIVVVVVVVLLVANK